MNDKLGEICTFLNENRQFNHALQEKYYLTSILPYKSTKDKVSSLLYNIANTQSQPKIDKLACSYKIIINDPSCLNSMRAFVEKINPKETANFEGLYNGMRNQDGWGKKTAALFSKNIYHFHTVRQL